MQKKLQVPEMRDCQDGVSCNVTNQSRGIRAPAISWLQIVMIFFDGTQHTVRYSWPQVAVVS